MERVRVRVTDDEGEGYLRRQKVECFSTGCQLLDCVLGGGWALGRTANIVGDKSTGKTLLAIEAAANFAKIYPKGKIWYNEVEAAFDEGYAESLGLPLSRTEFIPECTTVEDVFEDLEKRVKSCTTQGLYILDSLDALSDRAEQKRDLDEGTYGTGKSKAMSQMFRRLIQPMASGNVTFIIISQIRDNIGVMFGKKHTRSGGKALDFYASQVIWLAYLKKLVQTRSGVKRPVGIHVKVQCQKNKCGPPFRECEFPIMFNYGVDDVNAHLKWLEEVKRLKDLGYGAKASEAWRAFADMDDDTFDEKRQELARHVKKAWGEIEKDFEPARRKY